MSKTHPETLKRSTVEEIIQLAKKIAEQRSGEPVLHQFGDGIRNPRTLTDEEIKLRGFNDTFSIDKKLDFISLIELGKIPSHSKLDKCYNYMNN